MTKNISSTKRFTPSIAPAPVYIWGCGFHSALGDSHEQIHQCLADGFSPDMQAGCGWLNDDFETVIGKATGRRPALPARLKHYDTGNNRLALSALQQIEPQIQRAIAQFGHERVAVVIGTSTSGIADGETAMIEHLHNGQFPKPYHYSQQELANAGQFIADYFELKGPVYTISTACSSSGRVFLSARRLLSAGIVDAVIVGGADSLCRLTLNGFHGLEALSGTLCNPFSVNRKGINIGEAAAFMLLSQETAPDIEPSLPAIALLGAGDSSDAHHISAPHPEGNGAEVAMRKALESAQLSTDDIGYINAHGTATPLNDEMEAKAISRVFGLRTPVSSTKPLTGHTLGAASAVEAAICWHVLRYRLPLPHQVNDGESDALPITLATPGMALNNKAVLSNSFAFGGNNISLIFGYVND
ncbi:beta-ketoacyl-[acyl-carrier-protein] synthase family protein [Photobacterium makurazakiensis]|uniref:beta-ketoacyl-[acyl-carrier-protein] synthase family protein n=1 Tax=Photobacterium makurazakiensis TaxID=2910234 RepID=UPI003D0EA80B